MIYAENLLRLVFTMSNKFASVVSYVIFLSVIQSFQTAKVSKCKTKRRNDVVTDSLSLCWHNLLICESSVRVR